MANQLLTILDPDPDRGGAVAALVRPLVPRVVEVRGLDYLLNHWPQAGMLLVADTESLPSRLLDEMQAKARWRPFILYGESPSPGTIVDGVMMGAVDYLAWPISGGTLVERMDKWPQRASRIGKHYRKTWLARKRLSCLSVRETQVLKLIASGLTSSEIGAKFHIADGTVGVHRERILKKLNVPNSVLAARVAVDGGLV